MNFVVFKTYPARFPLEDLLGTFFGGFSGVLKVPRRTTFKILFSFHL